MGRIQKVKAALAERSEVPVTNRQIARVLGISEAKVELYLSAGTQPRSLDDSVPSSSMRADNEGDQVLADILEDEQPSAEDVAMQVNSTLAMPETLLLSQQTRNTATQLVR